MEPFKYHVFVCDQGKPGGVPSCRASGSGGILDELRREIANRGLIDDVQVTTCGSLGLCESGPNMVVYPEGTWYSGLRTEDIGEIVRSHFEAGAVVERLARSDTSSVRAEIISNRTKMLSAIRARESAGVLPDDLAQSIRGFQESRVLLTAIELDVFTAVGSGADAEAVASRIGTDPRATAMLLNAVVALGLLSKSGSMYRNSPVAARYLAEGSRDNARPGLMHTVHLWTRWSTLTDCVRAGTTVAALEERTGEKDWTDAFISAMDRNATERAPLVVKAVGAQDAKKMLDVGGGSAAYSIAFARASQALQVELLDVPEVVSIARRNIEMAGLASRVSTRIGDLRADALGQGYDLVFVSQICHMLSVDQNRDLARRCYEATASGGRTVVQEFILEADKTSPRSAALFALNMLVGTRAGAAYSADEYFQWMGEAGFENVRHVRLPGPSGLIIGTRR